MDALNRVSKLGDATQHTSHRKLWIAAAIGAVGGLASSIIGGAAASKAAREAERRQRQQEAEERAWYDRRYNEDYVDTAAGQNLVRRAKEYAKENWKKAQGAQAVGGGTDAATAMAKEAGNKMVGNTIADIAATDTQRKAQVDAQHMQNRGKFAQMDIDRANQKAANITAAAQQASNALISAGQAVEGATAAKSGPSLTGESNNSKIKVGIGKETLPEQQTGNVNEYQPDPYDGYWQG